MIAEKLRAPLQPSVHHKMKTHSRSLQVRNLLRDLFSEKRALAMDAFVSEIPFELQKLRSAVLRGDRPMLAELGRALREASARVGAQAMAQQAAQLEILVGEGAGNAIVSTVLQRLQVAFLVIAPQMRAHLREIARLQV
jgi:HPt (histidine-containing phosphotransfer) domain-containing protein